MWEIKDNCYNLADQEIREAGKIENDLLKRANIFLKNRRIRINDSTPGRLNKRLTKKVLDKKFNKEVFEGEEKVARTASEFFGKPNDPKDKESIAYVIKKVLKVGDVGSANLTKKELKIFKSFKKAVSDMVDYGLFDKDGVDELLRFIKQSEVPTQTDIPLNFNKVIKQLKESGVYDTFTNPPGGMMGGVFDGPDTGYLAVLHGKERIIPEENRYTRSKGQSQGMKQNIFIFQDGNNNNNIQPQQGMQTPKTQMVPIFVPADPFDVATKYSELIAKVTVWVNFQLVLKF